MPRYILLFEFEVAAKVAGPRFLTPTANKATISNAMLMIFNALGQRCPLRIYSGGYFYVNERVKDVRFDPKKTQAC